MRYLLDTNTCIRYINGRAPQIQRNMDSKSYADIAVSTITMGEMYYGSAKSRPQNDRANYKMDFYDILTVYLLMMMPPKSTVVFGPTWNGGVRRYVGTIC